MRSMFFFFWLLLVLSTGCASMCDSSYDCDFHCFGGLRDRQDRTNGRVGSAFDPATATAAPYVPPTQISESETESGFEDEDGTEGESDDAERLRNRLMDELPSQLPTIPEPSPDSGPSPEFEFGSPTI